MRSSAWLKRASLATALFVAGAVAGDFAVRGSRSQPLPEITAAPVQVVHKRKVRTVHPPPGRGPAIGPSAGAPPTAAATFAATAAPVSSRTSPGSANGGGSDEGGWEVEHDD